MKPPSQLYSTGSFSKRYFRWCSVISTRPSVSGRTAFVRDVRRIRQ